VQGICLIVRAWCAYAPSDTHLSARNRCIYMVCLEMLCTCALVNHSHRDPILSSLTLCTDRSHHTKMKVPYQASSFWSLVCICQQIHPGTWVKIMILTLIADSSLFFSSSSMAATSSFIFCLQSSAKESLPNFFLRSSPLSPLASKLTLVQYSIVRGVSFETGCEVCSFEVLEALLVVEGTWVDLSVGVGIVWCA
jgi:hypothetical protein